jgi:hypothetical protein
VNALGSLPGTVFVLGDSIRSRLARACEIDDVTEIRKLLTEANEEMSAIIQQAKAAVVEIEGAVDT